MNIKTFLAFFCQNDGINIRNSNISCFLVGEEVLPEEDLNKIFKPLPPPSRLNALVLAGQTLSSAENVSQFCTQSLAKWFVTEALQKAKVDDNSSN